MNTEHETSSYLYDSAFMAVSEHASVVSARAIVSTVGGALIIRSLLDVGCATGIWLKAWRQSGIDDLHGIDGEYARPAMANINDVGFTAADISHPINLGRQYDLVQSLEVAEHLPHGTSATFIDTLTKHSNGYVLFSAAPPGQGGEHHVNEQSPEFWRQLFYNSGFMAFDYVRPLIGRNRTVSYWYRFNTILYVHRDRIEALPDQVRSTQIEDEIRIPDVSPIWFQLRKSLVRRLPAGTQDSIARLKARLAPNWRI